MEIAAQMRDAAARGLTGRLDITGSEGAAGIVFFRGRVCAVDKSAAGPALGMRLVSGGSLSLTRLGAALARQRQHPQMQLADVLVRMGLVDQQEVDAVTWEQMCDEVAEILGWSDATVRFTAGSDEGAAPAGRAVEDVLTTAAQRAQHWQQTVGRLGGPDTVPRPSDDALATRDAPLHPLDWAVLCLMDGERSLAAISAQSGLSTLEAAAVLESLVEAGLADLPQAPNPARARIPQVQPPVPLPRLAEAPKQPAGKPAPRPAGPVTAQDPAGPRPADTFDDPAELLRELSQLSHGSLGARTRGGR